MFWGKKKKKDKEKQENVLKEEQEIALDKPLSDDEPELRQDEIREVERTEKQIIKETEITPTPESVSEEKTLDENDEKPAKKSGWLSRLTKGLSKSSDKIGQGIVDIFTKKKLDDDTLEELEELLITADMGPSTASKIVEPLRKERFGKDIETDEVKSYLSEKITEILNPVAQPLSVSSDIDGPYVILVAGVNGVGKTTTIGKLAKWLKDEQGKTVMMAAGDTFRAAAVEQLQIWGDRVGSKVIAKDIGADAASVAYEAYEAAREENADILMVDTAGRLHNKSNLMEELAKIVRVLKKQNENLPHACLLVLDATTGQNAHAQVETFKEMVDVTGLIVTKLDGSAKGGVVVSLADQFELPVHMIGVGETAEDLRPFNAEDFANSLVGR